MSRAVLVLITMLSACSERGDTDDGGQDSDDTIVDTDSGTDTDSGAGTDAGPPTRTIYTGACARSYTNGTCSNDVECMTGGCGGEMCANEGLFTTCDCTAPPASCGCVDGKCVWSLHDVPPAMRVRPPIE